MLYLIVDDETVEYGIAGEATYANASAGWGDSASFYDVEVYNDWTIEKLN